MSSTDDILERLERIEKKLDFFIQVLSADDEDEDEPRTDLDGNPSGAPRDTSQPLS